MVEIVLKSADMKTRVVFMGSPDFALPILCRLVEEYDVVGVVTQPDRPAGRGKTLQPPSIKILAGELNLPVIQPIRLKEALAWRTLQEWQPDLIIVAAFGQILRQNVLDLPRFGCINIHASLLPRWRGAAPIQAAILNGDASSGVTIMKMDAGIDTGAVLAQVVTSIDSQETAVTLSKRLSGLGANLLMKTLPDWLAGNIVPQEQDNSLVTYARMLKKEDGAMDLSHPAYELERAVRAYTPWPGSYISYKGNPLKVLKACVLKDGTTQAVGTHTVHNGLPAIATTSGWLLLNEVQLAGKQAMSGEVFLRGARAWLTSEN